MESRQNVWTASDTERNTEQVTEQIAALKLYRKVIRITEKGKDAKIRKKKDGILYVYEEILNPA